MTGVVPCYKSAMAVSILCTRLAARPALLTEDVNNKKDRWSRHGLGQPLNRADPEASDRNWTATVWEMIIRKGCGLKTAVPKFVHLPAVGRTTVSTPFLLKSFEALNARRSYIPKIIPPRSRVRLLRADPRTATWKKTIGRQFRIGYYSRKDGLDCIWLVNENGAYEQTTADCKVFKSAAGSL